jgi:uncharacterized MAPEG superfamily protein
MTTELRWLIYTAVFAATLWSPYIVGVNISEFEGKDTIFARPPDASKMPPWVHRSLRAHQNLLEQFLPFAAIVLAGSVAGVSTPTTETCAILFFWLRVVHAIGMITGLARAPIRPMIYVAGWATTLVYAWQALTVAASR